jgi:hypothetical protein
LLKNRRSPFDGAHGERRLFFERIAKIPFMLSLSKHGIHLPTSRLASFAALRENLSSDPIFFIAPSRQDRQGFSPA